MPEWWNGRHEGLKIPWALRPCGFEPRFRYEKSPTLETPKVPRLGKQKNVILETSKSAPQIFVDLRRAFFIPQ